MEQKKAFIQAYSGVDLKEELHEQEMYQHSLRMAYAQKLRQNEEMQLIKDSQTVPNGSNDAEREGTLSINSEEDTNASHVQQRSETPIKYENIESDTISRKASDEVLQDLQAVDDISDDEDDDDLSVTELSKQLTVQSDMTLIRNKSGFCVCDLAFYWLNVLNIRR